MKRQLKSEYYEEKSVLGLENVQGNPPTLLSHNGVR